MFAVIFHAEFRKPDEEYCTLAKKLRELAIEKYGCKDFTSVSDDANEITISYWDSLEQIEQWRQDSRHLYAQEKGKTEWYKRYKIQVVSVEREYQSG